MFFGFFVDNYILDQLFLNPTLFRSDKTSSALVSKIKGALFKRETAAPNAIPMLFAFPLGMLIDKG